MYIDKDQITPEDLSNFQSRAPGSKGVYLFVLIDMTIFSIMFASYVFERSHAMAVFDQSQETLDITLGAINTLILLTSSWFMVLSISAVKRNLFTTASNYLLMTFICGVIFIANKLYEYDVKINSGVSMLTNDFYVFYYVLTGLHCVHVIIGMMVLFVLWRSSRKKKYCQNNYYGMVVGATYWHMVDVLWIMIFPLLYILR